ncbi:MAG: TIR domain-containing protein [Phycisphaeraceae bacterium]
MLFARTVAIDRRPLFRCEFPGFAVRGPARMARPAQRACYNRPTEVTMLRHPVVYISCTSDLHSARDHVTRLVTSMGCEGVQHHPFATGDRGLLNELRKHIESCSLFIQLVGAQYGEGPLAPSPEFGRVSYAQFEGLYAEKVGRKVVYMLMDSTFPADSSPHESDEFRHLQDAYRKWVEVKHSARVYHIYRLKDLDHSVCPLLHALAPNPRVETPASTDAGAPDDHTAVEGAARLREAQAAPHAPTAPPEPPEPTSDKTGFIFISYKREDLSRITPYLHRIVSWGYPIWYDRGIPGGAEWDVLIEEKVTQCKALLVFLSEAAVNSKWVRREIKFADSEQRPILGIRLDKDVELKHGLKLVLSQFQLINATSADFSAELRRAVEYTRLL